MKKKWIPHIIAVTAFGLFIVLGLACATMTPEERAAHQAAQEARQTDGKGGTIIVRHIGSSNVSYCFLRLNHPGSGSRGSIYNLYKAGDSHRFIVDEDGSYTIRYRILEGASEALKYESGDFNSIKTVYVSNDQTVYVNIP